MVSTNEQIVSQTVSGRSKHFEYSCSCFPLFGSTNYTTPTSDEVDLETWREEELRKIRDKMDDINKKYNQLSGEIKELEESVNYISSFLAIFPFDF